MKRYIYYIAGICLLFFTNSCNDNTTDLDAEEVNQLTSLHLSLGDVQQDAVTRAIVPGYAVNTANDPTHTMNGRENWELDFALVTNSVQNQSVFTWDGTAWIPTSDIFFPNYNRQSAIFTLAPATWNSIAPDQSAANGSALLGQDVLEQNGTPSVVVMPAHILELEARHAHSMLDFKFVGIDPTHISAVNVVAGGVTYQPYKVQNVTDPEYLVILPVGTDDPVVRINTVGGTNYFQTLVDAIDSTQVNHCYCFTLQGLELILGEVTIANWITGPGIEGEYTSEVSYPTFRGPPNLWAVLYYDNGLNQRLEFNDQGETTVKPVGRNVNRVVTSTANDVSLPNPFTLSGMIIDLNSYF